jgi:hypothetical protein
VLTIQIPKYSPGCPVKVNRRSLGRGAGSAFRSGGTQDAGSAGDTPAIPDAGLDVVTMVSPCGELISSREASWGEKEKLWLQPGQVALTVRGGMALLGIFLLKPQWGQVTVSSIIPPFFH